MTDWFLIVNRENKRFENLRAKLVEVHPVKNEKTLNESLEGVKYEKVEPNEKPDSSANNNTTDSVEISREVIDSINETLKFELHELHKENIRLTKLCSELQAEHHTLKSEVFIGLLYVNLAN